MPIITAGDPSNQFALVPDGFIVEQVDAGVLEAELAHVAGDAVLALTFDGVAADIGGLAFHCKTEAGL